MTMWGDVSRGLGWAILIELWPYVLAVFTISLMLTKWFTAGSSGSRQGS